MVCLVLINTSTNLTTKKMSKENTPTLVETINNELSELTENTNKAINDLIQKHMLWRKRKSVCT
jgi:hypothetical protein